MTIRERIIHEVDRETLEASFPAGTPFLVKTTEGQAADMYWLELGMGLTTDPELACIYSVMPRGTDKTNRYCILSSVDQAAQPVPEAAEPAPEPTAPAPEAEEKEDATRVSLSDIRDIPEASNGSMRVLVQHRGSKKWWRRDCPNVSDRKEASRYTIAEIRQHFSEAEWTNSKAKNHFHFYTEKISGLRPYAMIRADRTPRNPQEYCLVMATPNKAQWRTGNAFIGHWPNSNDGWTWRDLADAHVFTVSEARNDFYDAEKWLILMRDLQLSDGRTCTMDSFFDEATMEMISLAPNNPYVRGHIMRVMKQMPPDDAKTFEQIRDWVEKNFEWRIPMPVGTDDSVVDFSNIARRLDGVLTAPPTPPQPDGPTFEFNILDIYQENGLARYTCDRTDRMRCSFNADELESIIEDALGDFNEIMDTMMDYTAEKGDTYDTDSSNYEYEDHNAECQEGHEYGYINSRIARAQQFREWLLANAPNLVDEVSWPTMPAPQAGTPEPPADVETLTRDQVDNLVAGQAAVEQGPAEQAAAETPQPQQEAAQVTEAVQF